MSIDIRQALADHLNLKVDDITPCKVEPDEFYVFGKPIEVITKYEAMECERTLYDHAEIGLLFYSNPKRIGAYRKLGKNSLKLYFRWL